MIELTKSDSNNPLLSEYDINWFEHDMSSGKRENRSTWPVDIIISKLNPTHFIFIECKGGSSLSNRDKEQLKKYQRIKSSDLTHLTGEENVDVNYLYLMIPETYQKWENYIEKESIPTIVFDTENKELEGYNLFHPLDKRISNTKLESYSNSNYPFSSDDSDEYIYSFVVAGLITFFSKQPAQASNLHFTIDDILPFIHKYYPYISGDESRVLKKNCANILNKIIGHEDLQDYFKKFSNKKVARTRYKLEANLNSIIHTLKEHRNKILSKVTLDDFF